MHHAHAAIVGAYVVEILYHLERVGYAVGNVESGCVGIDGFDKFVLFAIDHAHTLQGEHFTYRIVGFAVVLANSLQRLHIVLLRQYAVDASAV